MDVTCERCSTAYEFDDALVSERGTTVKCTNCGHQFKVRRATIVGPPERWQVRTIDGREFEFRALRELQGAIAQSTISREDVLSRGGSRPRRLGSIAELEPFFANAAPPQLSYGTTPGVGAPRGRMPTPQGLGSVNVPQAQQRPDGSVADPFPIDPVDDSLDATTRMEAPSSSRPRSVPPPTVQSGPLATPLPGVVVSPAGAPMPPPSTGRRAVSAAGAHDQAAPVDNEVTRIKSSSRLQRGLPASADDAALSGADHAPEAHRQPNSQTSASISHAPEPMSPLLSPMPPAPSSMGRSYEGDEPPPSESPRRPGAARWIVGVVVAGMLALTFATVGKKWLVPSPPPASSSVSDERIGALLQEGEKDLLDGDLEGAKEHFDKASVLSERDPRLAADLARLVMVRADLVWLQIRLLADNDPDRAAAKRELEQVAQRARKAADRAAELAPTEPSVIRARIDALRLAGDLDGARRLVSGISAASSQPDNALALAELDLAEAKPDWATVIDRLRAALSQDQNLGRARSMLVYALARSGDLTSAQAEIERLSSLPRPHPLVQSLRAFVAREGSAPPPASASPSASASASASASVSASATAGKPAAGRVPAAPNPGRDSEPSTSSGKSDGKVPDDYVSPNPSIDTSDLPGVKHTPPSPAPSGEAPKPPAPSTSPPGVDTSDLPGFK